MKPKYAGINSTVLNDGRKVKYIAFLDWQFSMINDKNYSDEKFVNKIKADIKRMLNEGLTPEELTRLEKSDG